MCYGCGASYILFASSIILIKSFIAVLTLLVNEFSFMCKLLYFFAYVREDNPRALTSGLSPVHTHNHTITVLLHQHACALCAL